MTAEVLTASTPLVTRFDSSFVMDASSRFRAVNTGGPAQDNDKQSFGFRPDPAAMSPTFSAVNISEDNPDRVRVDGLYDALPPFPSRKDAYSSHATSPQERHANLHPLSHPGNMADARRESLDPQHSDVQHRPIPSSWNRSDAQHRQSWATGPPTSHSSADNTHVDESQRRATASEDRDAKDETMIDDTRADSPRHESLTSSNAAGSGGSSVREPMKRKFTNRTKTGCHTCRRRKKKCDEGKPKCQNCIKGEFTCGGYGDKLSQVSASPHPSMASPPNIQAELIAKERDAFHRPFTRGHSAWPSGTIHPRLGQVGHLGPRESWDAHTWPQQAGQSHARMVGDPAMDLDRDQIRRQDSLFLGARPGTSIGAVFAAPTQAGAHGHASSLLSQSDMEKYAQRNKMLAGRPYRNWDDAILQEDRDHCRETVELFNNAIRPSQGIGKDERSRMLRAMIYPELRRFPLAHGQPFGFMGRDVVVDGPFMCEYGYNIHLDDEVVIQTDCFIQDPCRISIGARTVIGPHVKFYGMAIPTDYRARGGARTVAVGAPITVEADCHIGPGSIILAGVTIRNGSVIAPGTVVDQDVPSNVEFGSQSSHVLRGISILQDQGPHNPLQHENDEVASLMMRR